MKVAIVHDYIKEYGGAERVLEALHELFPKAPVFTSVYIPSYLGPHKDRFKDWDIRPSFLQWLPFKARLISPLRLITPFVFKSMNFDNFDVALVSATGAYEPNLIKKGRATQICYYHTPPRYLYGYETARNWKKHATFVFFAEIANHFLRIVDFYSSQNVDVAIANSKEVGGRIWKFYKKKAVVIYPPVDIPNYKPSDNKEYYVAGGRLARAKRIDLAIKACNELNLPLKVFGRGFASYEEELRKIAGSTVEFLGEISDQEKWEVLGKAKAYISPSIDEDFGILNVEAMAVGTAVIVHKSGGAIETIIDGKTGIFFENSNVEDVVKAIKKLQRAKIKQSDCVAQAKKFSKERFKKEMKKLIEKYA